MATYKSDPTLIHASAEKVFGKLRNIEGLRDILANLPADRIPEDKRQIFENMTFTPDSITIPGGPVGSLTLKQTRLEEPRLIELSGVGAPVPLSLALHIEPKDEENCSAHVAVNLEIPAIMKPMVAGPMNQMVSQFSQVLSALSF